MKIKVSAIIVSLMVFLCGCDWHTFRHPYQFGDSVWVCSAPEITYYVVGSADEESFYDYAVAVIDGQNTVLDFAFQSTTIAVYKQNDDGTYSSKMFLSGDCRYSKNKFTVTVSKDDLFDGQYTTLEFNRVRGQRGTQGDGSSVLTS